jgi:hypothetical protein
VDGVGRHDVDLVLFVLGLVCGVIILWMRVQLK